MISTNISNNELILWYNGSSYQIEGVKMRNIKGMHLITFKNKNERLFGFPVDRFVSIEPLGEDEYEVCFKGPDVYTFVTISDTEAQRIISKINQLVF